MIINLSSVSEKEGGEPERIQTIQHLHPTLAESRPLEPVIEFLAVPSASQSTDDAGSD
jgi:hypothetical protein